MFAEKALFSIRAAIHFLCSLSYRISVICASRFLYCQIGLLGLELVCQNRDIKRASTIAKRYRLLCTPLLIPTLGSRIHGREDGPFGLCADLRRRHFLMQNHDADAVGLSAILTHEIVVRCLIGQRHNTDHVSQFFRPRVNDAPTACRAKQFRHAPPSVIVSFFQPSRIFF